LVLTDWQDVEKLQGYHHTAGTAAEAIELALAAGVDMSMVPQDLTFSQDLEQMVTSGALSQSRIDESVARILGLKEKLGLFEHGGAVVPPAMDDYEVGHADDQAFSLQYTRETMTLLKNAERNSSGSSGGADGDNVLPLTWLPSGAKVLVVGPAATRKSVLCGGWTANPDSAIGACGFSQTIGSSIADALTAMGKKRGLNVEAIEGVVFGGQNAADPPLPSPAVLANVTKAAQNADVVVMALGEGVEAETGGDINQLDLDEAQQVLFATVQAAVATTAAEIVTVLAEARPRLLGKAIPAQSGAILMAYLPCLHGGQAVAETLLGQHNPSGRLTFSYPMHSGDLTAYYHKPSHGLGYSSNGGEPLFPFGTGLSYSEVVYANVSISSTAFDAATTVGVNVSVDLRNVGTRDVDEVVLVFVRQRVRRAITPEVKLLKGFTKVAVKAGQEARAMVTLMTEDLSYWSPELRRFIDAGTYDIMVGNLSIPLSIASGAEIKTMHGNTTLHPLAPPASAEAVPATSEALGPSLVDQLLAAASIANEGAGEGVSLAVREKRMRELFEDLTQHLKVPAGGQVKL
jgi:beta-glucosidase